jgi:hypothetical protein
MLLDAGLSRPNARIVYITKTRGMAKNIVMSELKRFDKEFELGCSWHNTELRMTLPNGSTIQLSGSENTNDADKFRGQSFDLAVIDEAQGFKPELLTELIYDVLRPCLMDRVGRLVMIGTPGYFAAGPFWEATGPASHHVIDVTDGRHHDERTGERRAHSRRWDERDRPELHGVEWEWSLHHWSTKDNVAAPNVWKDAQYQKRIRGWTDDDPRWLREYLGQWAGDDGRRVYRYDPTRWACSWTPDSRSSEAWGLPEGHEWHFIAGMDFGYDDPFSIEVAAWADTHDTMFHVYDFAQSEMTIADIAAKIREVESMFGGFEAMVGDRAGQAKTLFESLSSMYGLNIEPSEKHQKRDYIDLLNSDLAAGRVRILADSELATEMTLLTWDETGRYEDKSTPNHRCDGFLYLWRYAYHHFFRKRTAEPEPGSTEWIEKKAEESLQAMSDAYERREAEKRERQTITDMEWSWTD